MQTLLFQLQSHQLESCSSDTSNVPSVNQPLPHLPAADKAIKLQELQEKNSFLAGCLCGKNKVQNSLYTLSYTNIHFPVASLPKKVSIRKYLVFI